MKYTFKEYVECEIKIIKNNKMMGEVKMKKYVLVGASMRCFYMFAKPLASQFSDVAQIVGIFDINKTRAEFFKDEVNNSIPVYTDFYQMMQETKPDTVIIATIDKYHHEYIIKSLEYGCNVITEKPMTIDEEKCKAILSAEKRTGKKVTVTFNCRFMPYIARIKELLREGVVGKILSIDYEYFLDTSHGADYFRRWHRRKENSGGLLVHKATHHFDIINWWLEEEPEIVYASGSLRYYGPTREKRGIRCVTCKYAEECEFAVKYKEDAFFDGMYFKAEKEDGYFRDSCVFSEEIDIEDTMALTVNYSKGAILSYSLIAYSPYEGWRVTINGTEGRLEAREIYSGSESEDSIYHINLYNRTGERVTYDFKKSLGAHGGGDERLQRILFRGDISDPLGQVANSYSGALSIMIGICANKSIKDGKPHNIKALIE